jgi:hypothetical protein
VSDELRFTSKEFVSVPPDTELVNNPCRVPNLLLFTHPAQVHVLRLPADAGVLDK